MKKAILLVALLATGFATACTNRATNLNNASAESPAKEEPASQQAEWSADDEPTPEKKVFTFPERQFAGTPLIEEHHRVLVFWDSDKRRLNICKKPENEGSCAKRGAIVKRGDEITWKNSIYRVRPRILTARNEVKLNNIHGKSTTIPKGTHVALYVYQGEGTCAIAVGNLFDPGVNCPRREDFDGYPEPRNSTAKTLAPRDYTWWVELDKGWIRLDPSEIRVEFESRI